MQNALYSELVMIMSMRGLVETVLYLLLQDTSLQQRMTMMMTQLGLELAKVIPIAIMKEDLVNKVKTMQISKANMVRMKEGLKVLE